MAVKPSAGETIVQETRTRVETPSLSEEKQGGRKHPPMWDFIESLPLDHWNTKDYEMTLYRGTKSNRGPWCGKFYEPMTPDKIQEKFGGGGYVIYVKVPPGNQLRYYEEIEIVGAPKTDFSVSTAAAHGASTSEIGQILAMMREDRQMFMAAIERLSGSGSSQEAVKQALALNGQVFSSAMPSVVETLKNVGSNGGNNSSGMDDITKEFLRAAISKMMNPPSATDPIETFAKMAGAMSNLGFKMGGNPSGGLAVELVRGLVGSLPQLAAHVGGIMDQYRRIEETKLQQVTVMRGGAPAAAAPPPAAAQPAHSNVIEMSPAPSDSAAGNLSPEATMSAEQMFQYVEIKVVEILKDMDLTPEEAANSALTFIDVTDKNLVDELLRHGEQGLHWAFANRETLKKVPQGERLDAFIRAFVQYGRKVAVPIPTMPDPSIPPA